MSRLTRKLHATDYVVRVLQTEYYLSGFGYSPAHFEVRPTGLGPNVEAIIPSSPQVRPFNDAIPGTRISLSNERLLSMFQFLLLTWERKQNADMTQVGQPYPDCGGCQTKMFNTSTLRLDFYLLSLCEPGWRTPEGTPYIRSKCHLSTIRPCGNMEAPGASREELSLPRCVAWSSYQRLSLAWQFICS